MVLYIILAKNKGSIMYWPKIVFLLQQADSKQKMGVQDFCPVLYIPPLLLNWKESKSVMNFKKKKKFF